MRMDMPFKRLPEQFIIEFVKRAAILINSLPLDEGGNDAISPGTIVTGKLLQIGEYVQVKVPITNQVDEKRTVDASYIGTNDNSIGWYVFILKTKEKISVRKVTPIPMSESMMKDVNKMGAKEGKIGYFQFGNQYGGVAINDKKNDKQTDEPSYKPGDHKHLKNPNQSEKKERTNHTGVDPANADDKFSIPDDDIDDDDNDDVSRSVCS